MGGAPCTAPHICCGEQKTYGGKRLISPQYSGLGKHERKRKLLSGLYHLATACFLFVFLTVPCLLCSCGSNEQAADRESGNIAEQTDETGKDAVDNVQAASVKNEDPLRQKQEIKEKKEKASQLFFDGSEKKALEAHKGEGALLRSETYLLCGIPVIAFYPETGHTQFTAEIGKHLLSLESQLATALISTGISADEDTPGMLCDGSEGIILDYDYYGYGIYISWAPRICPEGAFVNELLSFSCPDGKNGIHSAVLLNDKPLEGLQPLVYSSVTRTVMTAESMFFEPFFAVLKHDWTDAEGITLPGDEYNISDYKDFCLSEKGITFRTGDSCAVPAGGAGAATPEATSSGDSCSFTMTFEEIEPYMHYGFDGASNEDRIRKDLDPDARMVALTFDDGPGSGTKRIANIIAAYGGRCTFFGVGDHMEDGYYAERVQYVLDKGHEYGTHGYSHKIMTTLSHEDYWDDIYKAVKANVKATGKCPTLMRLPGGNINDYIRETSPFTLVYWGMGTADWSYRTMFETQEEVTDAIWKVADDFLPSSGKSCLLMHDLYSETAAAVEYMVPILASRGYQFVTVSELLYYKGLVKAPGQYYDSVKLR